MDVIKEKSRGSLIVISGQVVLVKELSLKNF